MKRMHLNPKTFALVALGSALVTTGVAPVGAGAAPLAARLPVDQGTLSTVPPLPATQGLPPTTDVDPSVIQVNRKPAIPFKSFRMVDPKTGKPIDPDKVITLQNGHSMTAGDYYADLNDQERGFNALGYTLRNRQPVVLQQTQINTGALLAQASGIAALHKPFDPQTMVTPLSPQAIAAQHRLRARQDAVRLQRLNQALAAKTALTGNSLSQSKSFNYEFGDRDTLRGFVNGREDLTADTSQAKLSAEANAGGSIFGSDDLNLIHGSASASAVRSGALKANLTLNVLGNSVISKDYSGDASSALPSIQDGGTLASESFDQETDLHFALGPIPMSVKFGVHGNASLGYGLTVIPVVAAGTLTADVDGEVYAQAAVDIGIVSVGAGGQVTLVKGNAALKGVCRLDIDEKGPYLELTFDGQDSIQMLAGKVYAFADIDLLFYSKHWEYDIWDFDGFSAGGDLFNGHFRQDL
jgi:hypothetical protein